MSSTSQINPQSLNLYAYVTNNPISYVDPSGLNLRAVQECHYEMIEFRVNGELDSVEWQQVCTTRYEIDNGSGGGDPTIGGGGQTGTTEDRDEALRQRLRRLLLDSVSKTCQQALKVLGITEGDLMKAFDAAKFLIDPNHQPPTGAVTNRDAKTITSRNGMSSFASDGGPIGSQQAVHSNTGFLRHELTHIAAKLGDEEIYNRLSAKGLPIDIRQERIFVPSKNGIGHYEWRDENPPKNQNGKYSNALSDFFNTFCN